MKLKPLAIASGLIFSLNLSTSCDKNKSSDPAAKEGTEGDDKDDDSGSSTAGTIVGISDNGLATSYPEGLQLSAFPKKVDSDPGKAAVGTIQVSSGSLADNVQQQTDDSFNSHPKEQLEKAQEVLNGESDSCFDEQQLQALSFNGNNYEFCFGFDYGIISGVAIGSGDAGQINPILNDNQSSTAAEVADAFKASQNFQANTSGESCMVTTGRLMVQETANKLNGFLSIFRGLLCEAKKADKDKFDGKTVDLTEEAKKAPALISIKKAEITKLDDQNSRAVYKTAVEFSTGQNSKTTSIVLYHSPGADSNESYNGVLNISEAEDNNGLRIFKSMSYEKVSGEKFEDQKLKIEVRNVGFTSQVGEVDPFGDNGLLDPNSGVGENSGNQELSNIRYFAFDVNPSNYSGNISFWMNPGGNYQEAARGFIYESVQNDDGTLSGCSWAGAIREGSIRKMLKEDGSFKPSGCYTPQFSNGTCGAANDNQGPQVWKQCFKQNAEGIYLPDEEKITDTSNGFDILQSAPTDMPNIDLSKINKFENL